MMVYDIEKGVARVTGGVAARGQKCYLVRACKRSGTSGRWCYCKEQRHVAPAEHGVTTQ